MFPLEFVIHTWCHALQRVVLIALHQVCFEVEYFFTSPVMVVIIVIERNIDLVSWLKSVALGVERQQPFAISGGVKHHFVITYPSQIPFHETIDHRLSIKF